MLGESAQGILVALIVVLAVTFLWSCRTIDRLMRQRIEHVVKLTEAQQAARHAMAALACKNVELARSEHLVDLQRRAQTEIERLFLGVVREVAPELATALARDFARVNAHLGMHRALAPHRKPTPPPKGGPAHG